MSFWIILNALSERASYGERSSSNDEAILDTREEERRKSFSISLIFYFHSFNLFIHLNRCTTNLIQIAAHCTSINNTGIEFDIHPRSAFLHFTFSPHSSPSPSLSSSTRERSVGYCQKAQSLHPRMCLHESSTSSEVPKSLCKLSKSRVF